MSVYMRNYWSLYLDFLDDFKGIKYKDISLPYLCHFRSLVRVINPIIQTSTLKPYLRHKANKKQVQLEFNRFLASHTKRLRKNPNGVVVFHDLYNLLRLPENNSRQFCDPAKTMFISEAKISQTKQSQARKPTVSMGHMTINASNRSNKVQKKNVSRSKLPVDYFQNYSTNPKVSIRRIIQQVRSIFAKYKKHPLYSNKAFQSRLIKQFTGIITRIEESENFFSKVNVSCIVLASTHYHQSRTFAIVALKKGIPSICLQHGIIASETGYIPKIATVDALYGQFEVDWYKNAGATKQSLEIIGHPRFDIAYKKSAISRTQFHKRFGLDPSKKTILIVLRGDVQINRWKRLIDTISKELPVNFVVKDFPEKETHPLSKSYSFVRTVRKFSLYDIFPNVDLVVAYPSTVGLEAMLAKKPVFILNYQFNGDTGYYEKLGALYQQNPETLGRLVIKYFKDPKFKQTVEKRRGEFLAYAYPSKHLSGERLKKLINRLTT